MKTEEYFKGNQFSIDAFNRKYRLHDDETYPQAIKRVTDYIASAEDTQELRTYWAQRWYTEIIDDWWQPAGSIMQGAGNPKAVSMANCTTTSLGNIDETNDWDNLESIIRNAAYTVAKSAAYRQGLGIDFSKLRPVGTKVHNSASESTGVIHWMKFIDSLGYYVGQCLRKGTPVLTEAGYVPIEQLTVGTKVHGMSGVTSIVATHSNGPKEIHRIVTEYGDIVEASADHKLLCLQGRDIVQKPISELSVGTYLVSPLFRNNKTSRHYTKISPFTYPLNTYNDSNRLAVPEKVPTVIDETFAYLLGFIYGNGYMAELTEIAVSQDWPGVKEKLLNSLKTLFGTDDTGYGINVRSGDGRVERITLGKWFTSFIKHVGFTKGHAAELGFPEPMKNAPLSVLASFYSGLFDANGHNSVTKQGMVLELIDEKFLRTLKDEFYAHGIVFRLSSKNRIGYNPVYRLSLFGKRNTELLLEVTCSEKLSGGFPKEKRMDRLKTPYTASSIGVLPHKLDIRDINGSEFLSDAKYFKYSKKESALYIQKITDIQNTSKQEDTFDITVSDKDHLFAIPGMFVSNSGRIPAMLMSLNIKHPDVQRFIQVKKDFTQIQNANISVQLTNDFYEAVKADAMWTLEFTMPELKKGDRIYVDDMSTAYQDGLSMDESGRYYYPAPRDRQGEEVRKEVKARELMMLIAEHMMKYAEPGVQNIDIARKYSNSDAVYDEKLPYNSKIQSTNACVTPETPILTDNGYLPIATLENQKVNVWNGYEFSEVTIKETNQNQQIYRVHLSDGRYLDCTEYHTWKLVDGDRQTRDLVVGDKLKKYDMPVKAYDESLIKRVNTKVPTGLDDPAVISIEKVHIAPKVYCFNEPKNHTGCFNGIVTGQCSEQYLSRDGLCVLSSINVGRFSTDPKQYQAELETIGESINRFLDNVNEMEYRDHRYATHNQKLGIEYMRRTGAGITNISAWLLAQNLEYGRPDANTAFAEFMDYYNYVLYKSTIKLGHEKGSFKAFHPEKIKKSAFIQHMLEAHPDLTFDAMRNVTVSSIAPVGTLSLMFRNTVMSSGIEPPFGLYYWKRTRISGKYEYYFVVPNATKLLLAKHGVILDMPSDTVKDSWDGSFGKPIAQVIDKAVSDYNIRFRKDTEIPISEKLELMRLVYKSVDSAISTTYNLPSDVTVEDVYDFIMQTHEMGVKAVAAFPDRKMYGIVATIPFKDLALKLKADGVQIHAQNFSEEEQKELNINEQHIGFTDAPKRPKVLPADVYVVQVKGAKYLVAVGLLNGAPYEIFAGDLNGFSFKFKHKPGKIVKAKSGVYNLELDEVCVENFNEKFTQIDQAMFRMASTALRHGVSIKFIVEQLGKSSDDMFSIPKAAARVLKRYIKNGEPATGITCPRCKSTALVYIEGCVTCSACSWGKCD
jgi:ribonucleotide reductase alpha subunit